VSAVGSERRRSPQCAATGEMRRFRPFGDKRQIRRILTAKLSFNFCSSTYFRKLRPSHRSFRIAIEL
jgi:hypothetical protein